MTTVTPFPRVRNRPFVRKHAARMLELRPDTAEKHLVHTLQVQRDTMLRRGIHPDVAEQHLAELEAAIRCDLVRQMCQPTGGAT